MAVIKDEESGIKNVKIQCPVCNQTGYYLVDTNLIDPSKMNTLIDVPKKKICQHHFQFYIDKNGIVRGYQKILIEVKKKITTIEKLEKERKKEINKRKEIETVNKNMEDFFL